MKSPHVDVRSIVQQCVVEEERVLTSLEQVLARGGSSIKGILKSFVNDVIYSRAVLRDIAVSHVKRGVEKVFDVFPSSNEVVSDSAAAVLVVPGYFGPNHYMKYLADSFNWPAIWHPKFNGLRLTDRLMPDVEKYFDLMKSRTAPTIVVAHSRGGPTVLNMLKMLKDEGLDSNVIAVVLVSPISSGIRSEVYSIARYVPMHAITDMCPGSEATGKWGGLNATNRAKVVVVNGPNGDQFTSVEKLLLETIIQQ